MQGKPVAEVKRDFKRVLDAAERGESTVVLRHGRPVAVISPLPIARGGYPPLPKPRKVGNLLDFVGTFVEWPEIEEDMAEIIAARRHAVDRPPIEFD